LSRRSWALAWVPFGVCVLAVRAREVGRLEAAVSRRVNALPDSLHAPLWVVMQSGALAAPVVAAGVANAAGQRRLARRLLVTGLGSYYAAKAVKRWIGRGRPLDLVEGVLARGKPATGHGFVSGHAAVSTALAFELTAGLRGPARTLPLCVPPVVAFARVYVGAHLPLDVLGGAALGWALRRTM
jgi:membrane-associated phospholipid phosphatase